MQTKNPKIEVCFSPIIFPYHNSDNCIVLVVDILRATTAICAAFHNGVNRVIPIADVSNIAKYKENGFLIAGERDGIKLLEADFGNSPFNFTKEKVNGKTLVITTTNGTQAIEIAKKNEIVLGSFINLDKVCKSLSEKKKDVIILCSGWKNRFNIEDTLFAGAVTEKLIKVYDFCTECDSALASMDLWGIAKDNLLEYVQKASHRHRLKKLGLDDILEYSFTLNTTNVLPVLKDGSFICE